MRVDGCYIDESWWLVHWWDLMVGTLMRVDGWYADESWWLVRWWELMVGTLMRVDGWYVDESWWSVRCWELMVGTLTRVDGWYVDESWWLVTWWELNDRYLDDMWSQIGKKKLRKNHYQKVFVIHKLSLQKYNKVKKIIAFWLFIALFFPCDVCCTARCCRNMRCMLSSAVLPEHVMHVVQRCVAGTYWKSTKKSYKNDSRDPKP